LTPQQKTITYGHQHLFLALLKVYLLDRASDAQFYGECLQDSSFEPNPARGAAVVAGGPDRPLIIHESNLIAKDGIRYLTMAKQWSVGPVDVIRRNDFHVGYSVAVVGVHNLLTSIGFPKDDSSREASVSPCQDQGHRGRWRSLSRSSFGDPCRRDKAFEGGAPPAGDPAKSFTA
jgi:hypothetical protein